MANSNNQYIIPDENRYNEDVYRPKIFNPHSQESIGGINMETAKLGYELSKK
jgi:hypothetical protein